MLRSSRELTRVAFERNRIDLPGQMVMRVRRNDTALSVQLDDFDSEFTTEPCRHTDGM